MAKDFLAYCDEVWRGEATTADYQKGRWQDGRVIELADGVALFPAFGNVVAVRGEDGLLLFDTSHERFSARLHAAVREWSDLPLRYAVYSHGHIDHVFGVGPFDAEADELGRARPVVVGHEAVVARFDRYKLTRGYNEVINQRQFQRADARWPVDYRYPDVTYRDSMTLTVGGREVRLHHGKGETDDATYAYLPDQRVLLTGDMFIWVTPNAGNPQKVQRYPREWAQALRHMAGFGAEMLLPGHGIPIVGADRVRTALLDSAEYLESLVEQTLELMNRGARLDEIVHAVRPPEHLADKPYLRPVYDEPEFVVRNVWRLYGGWYDGNPAHLKPAPEAQLAAELAELSGGVAALAERAKTAAEAGELRLACHLVEFATQAEPANTALHELRADIYARRAKQELSTMSRGVFSWAAAESRGRISGADVLSEVAEAAKGKARWAI